MEENDFHAFILARMPSFIAMNYQRLLETQEPQEQVTLILHIYNLGLRALTINLVSQYFFRDRDLVRYPRLNKLLERKFPHLTLDVWEEILFAALRAYEDARDLFLMPELYDFYWDTSIYPHRERAEVKAHFDRLTKATQDLSMEHQPQDKSGWQTLAQELHGHLQKVLKDLSFIGQYDLIRVLAQDEHTYSFELHKGTQVLVSQRPLPKYTSLTNGRLYLRAATEEFLPLHPLLVFWEDTIESTNMGVFDRLVQQRLKYLLAAPDQIRFDEKYFKDFVYLILEGIEKAKQEHQKADKLTWEDLHDICEHITAGRMATVQGKYHQSLYLQRNAAHQHMKTFLADPKKRGFVLVGKSGVGKSNFLLALAEELRQARKDVSVLMYDGANLSVASSTLTDIISQDFSDHSLQPMQQVWQEIAKIDDINERQVVLCIDAINENPEATKLLRHLDELVQKSSWPWLKVVLSSRPETWKEIKRGVKLSEALYYRESSSEILGVELDPFSYSERMDSFTPQELPEVYSMYEREFNLKTPYQALSHQVREALRDPLQLLLLAKTYQRQAIPKHVKTSALIELYVNAVLQREERRFLEQQLVPLMVREGYYSNVITEAELDAAGGALYEKIYSDQMNQAFRTLSDADILVLQGQGREQKIAFKYERFYEYFAGKRIANLSETQADRCTFFLGLIEEITGKKKTSGKPFLWGVVKNALGEEARKPDSETIPKLCRTTEQRVKVMMVSVLIEVGLDMPMTLDLDTSTPLVEILKNLMPQEKKATEWRKGQQWLRKSPKASDGIARNARRIALEVASYLGIPWVLQRGALHEDQSLRTEAVRYSYNLWQQDQARGLVVLEYLAEYAVRGFIPNRAALESALGLSIAVFFDHYQDGSMPAKLQSIWRGIIAKILYIGERDHRAAEFVRTLLRERIFSSVVVVAFQLFHEYPGSHVSYYPQGLAAFFRLSMEEKALYRNLVQYIDVEGTYSTERMEHDYHNVMKSNNFLLVTVARMGLTAHARYDPLAFLPFLKRMFEIAKSNIETYPFLIHITKVLESMLDRDAMIDEVFDFFMYTLEVNHQCYTAYPQALRSPLSQAPEASYLGPHIFYQYQRTSTARTKWLEMKIQTAFANKNIPFFNLLVSAELAHVGIELRKPLIALEVLALFVNKSSGEIDRIIQSFLARLRVHYPDEVDDFLEEQHISEDFRLKMQTNEPSETVGELIGQRSWYFLRDEIILKSPELRSILIRIFDKAADCKNLRAWLNYFIRQIVNRIYGEEVLRQST